MFPRNGSLRGDSINNWRSLHWYASITLARLIVEFFIGAVRILNNTRHDGPEGVVSVVAETRWGSGWDKKVASSATGYRASSPKHVSHPLIAVYTLIQLTHPQHLFTTDKSNRQPELRNEFWFRIRGDARYSIGAGR